MKISIDNKEFIILNETQKKVIKNDIEDEIFEDDMKRRIEYVVKHKYEQSFKRLKEEWDVKLEKLVESVPTDPDKYSELVFSQKEYKSKSMRNQ